MALTRHVAALIGGVGGAKLALGLANLPDPPRLTFIVNTGDDFWHLGLKICPDMDTLTYTLAGMVNPDMGWGVAEDSAHVLDQLAARYGHDAWFKLGDKDLALHLLRTKAIRDGVRLTDFTRDLTRRLGIKATILPMCDGDAPTMIDTREQGEMSFQEYFVKARWQPRIKRIRYVNGDNAQMTNEVQTALQDADAILIAPSNPWLSIAPILAVSGMRQSLRDSSAPVVAVTPVIGGEAVKGPTAKIMREFGLETSARAVADFYAGHIEGFVDDIRNPHLDMPDLRVTRLDTLMTDLDKKIALARETLDWLRGWTA